MVTPQLLAESIERLSSQVAALQRHFPAPAFVLQQDVIPAFRHDQQDDRLMSFLKCLRCVSLLHAGLFLLKRGFCHEVGILCRCISESFEDVLFVSSPLGDGGTLSDHQRRVVEEFYQEEFEDPTKPVGSQPKRQRVPRDQVLAGIARLPGNPLNASDAKATTRMLHMSYSGYVHGAYPHIMELFGAPPGDDGKPNAAEGRYHVTGWIGGQPLGDMADAFASRVFQAAIAASVVAKRVGDADVVAALAPIIERIGEATGSSRVGDPNAAAKKIKSGKPLDV